MKLRRGAILICGPGLWRLGVTTDAGAKWVDTGISPGAKAEEIAAKLPGAMTSLTGNGLTGGRDRPLVLAVPSSACLAASIATNALPRSDRRQAMEYRLEGKLPLAIEEVSAQFISHNGRALGVCVRNDTISAAVKAIGLCGFRLAAVSPVAMLGFQGGLPGSIERGTVDVLIWIAGDLADVFLLEGGELVQWHSVPSTHTDLSLIVATFANAQGRSMRLAIRGADAEWSERIGPISDAQIVFSDPLAMQDAALQTAAGIVSQEVDPLVNFPHEAAGAMSLGRPLIAAMAGVLLLCLSLIGGAVWRAGRYAAVSAECDAQEQRLYQQLFPNEPVPPGMESRLQSYAGQLGRSSASDMGLSPRRSVSSLTMLYDVLANLPPGARVQFDSLQFDSGAATLHGRTGSLADADQIAAALRNAKHFLVDDPQTQQLADGGVGFTITAQREVAP